MNELKQELEVDYHKVDLEVLCIRFKTDLATGKTKSSVEESQAKFGLNRLTPPKTTPEWVKF